MSDLALERLDHPVLAVRDLDATCRFHACVLAMHGNRVDVSNALDRTP